MTLTTACVAGMAYAGSKHAYVGVEKCGTCHGEQLYGDQVSAWRAGPHARAFETLGTERAAEKAAERGITGSPQQADECLRCHVTAHGANFRLIKFELAQTDSVQCESCHGAGADYRKRSVMADEKKAVKKGLVEQAAEVCLACHNDESPSWNPTQYTLADGSEAGFDYEQAKQKIVHPTPEEVRGKIAQIEEAREREEEKKKKKK